MKLWRKPFDYNPVAEPLGYASIDKTGARDVAYVLSSVSEMFWK